MSRPLTAEEHRVLTAAYEGRLRMNRSGRWTIRDEARPARKAREALQARGLIADIGPGPRSLHTTPLGASVLRANRPA